MLIDLINYFQAGKSFMESAIFNALPYVYSTGFSMILGGSAAEKIAGVLVVLGITAMLITGLWKVFVKVLGRMFFEFI